MNFFGDIDIDVANREQALSVLKHIPASLLRNNRLEKHNSGVYFHNVPKEPLNFLCAIPYKQSQELGYFKIDILNVHVYEKIKNEQHLVELMNRELDWSLMKFPEFVELLIHFRNHSNLVAKLQPDSILQMAMILALIRPSKKHLIHKATQHGIMSIQDEIWKLDGSEYGFKKSHAISYAMLVKIHALLLVDELMNQC